MSPIAIGAIAGLILGHVLRAVRQATLFPPRARPGNFHLMVALSIAYVINALLPFRIGEIARIFYVSARAGQAFGIVCASVIAERISDLIVVAFILLAFALFSHDTPLLIAAGGMTTVAAGTVILAVLLQTSSRARALYWPVASLFNERLRLHLVDTGWTTAQLLTSTALLRPRYVLLTLLMWSAYLLSYALLGAAIGIDTSVVTTTLLGSPLSSLLASQPFAGEIVVVTSLAALMILVAGLVSDRVGIRDLIRNRLHVGLPKNELSLALSGDSFARTADYGAILDAHFTGRRSAIANFGLHGVEGVRVRHLLPGGSDAITAVVEIGEGLAIRKFASGDAGCKLAEQARWLEAHCHELPLAPVVSQHEGASKFHYDMPYIASARDLYEMVHIMPLSESRRLLEQVVDRIARWHDGGTTGAAHEDALSAYVDQKVVANARTALHFAHQQLPAHYHINGGNYSLDEWACLLDPTWVRVQMPSQQTGLIHGDLTIENIVVCPESEPGWYLIDPNPGNLFDTPLIDWAKLMQSLNLGYETLNRGPPAQLHGDAIDIMFHRSRVYADLHAYLRDQLVSRLGNGQLREIAFHEIVNFLRLIPYKIRRDPAKAMTFFASTSILLRRYAKGMDG